MRCMWEDTQTVIPASSSIIGPHIRIAATTRATQRSQTSRSFGCQHGATEQALRPSCVSTCPAGSAMTRHMMQQFSVAAMFLGVLILAFTIVRPDHGGASQLVALDRPHPSDGAFPNAEIIHVVAHETL